MSQVSGSGRPDDIVRNERRLREEEADVYDEHVEGTPWLTRVNDYAVLRALDAQPGDTVLDAGCGTGRHLPELLRRSSSVIGVDHSERSLELAHEKIPVEDRDRVRLIPGDMRELPVEDASVDRVLTVGVVQHIPSDEYRQVALRELHRVLKPGGLGLVYVYRWGGKIKRKRDGYWGADGTLYRHAFTARELRRLFEEAGFTNLETLALPTLPGVFARRDGSPEQQYRLAGSFPGRALGLYLLATGTRA